MTCYLKTIRNHQRITFDTEDAMFQPLNTAQGPGCEGPFHQEPTSLPVDSSPIFPVLVGPSATSTLSGDRDSVRPPDYSLTKHTRRRRDIRSSNSKLW